MDLLRNINHSRRVLANHLEKEWDTSVIQELSEREIEIMYSTKVPKNAIFSSLGQGVGCNLSLQNRFVPSYYLHVIYFGFPVLGEPPTKLTKTCKDKFVKLYREEVISKHDSLLIIIPQTVSETIELAIEELYTEGQRELREGGLEPDVLAENEALSETLTYSLRHFRTAHIFQLEHIAIDISKHAYVPTQECIRDEPSVREILTECNATRAQLPVIRRTDPQAKLMRMSPGDVCKITRSTVSGDVIAYRVCQ